MRNILLWSLSALAFTTASCAGPNGFAGCAEGAAIPHRDLIERAVRKLVLQSQGSVPPGTIRYRSVADFLNRNPDCCFVTSPRNYAGAPFQLPIAGEVELAIRYRRAETGNAPYALRYVAVGPCPSNMEESERLLTAAEFEASGRWRWNWRMR